MTSGAGRRAPHALFAGSLAAAMLCGPADAQAPAGAAPEGDTILVKGAPPVGYKADASALARLAEPLIDTPQMIAIVPRQVIEDRQATSLSEVFRTSSGIAMGAGESSWQGTNLTLRGFNARNDLYLDGMRDFGSYTRDPFDLEQVEVLQGPSSILFGRGSTGGAINQVSKQPLLDGFTRGELVGGTDALARGTLDMDRALPGSLEGTAVRLNAMADRQEVAGRDGARQRRFGVAPSIAFGLGTADRVTLDYLHQQQDDRPDYGLPYLRGAPAPVARQTYYGFRDDYLHTSADVVTARWEHDFAPGVTLRDQARYATYGRRWRDTEPQVVTAGLTAATPLSAIQVNRVLQGGRSRETFAQNQMDLLATFKTGALTHDLAAGWEIGPESSRPTYDNGLNQPRASLLAPEEDLPFSGTRFKRVRVHTTAFTVGAYLLDTIKLGTHWQLAGGARWDRFDSRYVAQFYGATVATLNQPTTRQDVHQIDQQPSWRGSLVYKPVAGGTIYFDYSTSFNPSAEALSQIVAVRSFNTGNIGLAPEENSTYEVGTKWNLLGGRLQAQAALFREVKENARVPNPALTSTNILAGTQRVDGGEVEVAGAVTPDWQLTASYTHLDGKTIKTVPGGPLLNSPLFNAPRDSVAVWTTYRLAGRVQIGGGMNYQSRRYIQLTALPYTSVPGYVTASAVAKWQATDHVRLQVNVNNLTNRYYYDQAHGYHVIPGEARTALFTVAYTG